MSNENDHLDYVGVCPHGRVLTWISGCPESVASPSLAKDVAQIIKNGLSLERMKTSDARERIKPCDECRAANKAKKKVRRK